MSIAYNCCSRFSPSVGTTCPRKSCVYRSSERRPTRLFLSARSADRKPMLDPITERHLVGSNVLASVARAEQLAKLLSGIRWAAAERHRIALLADAITQAEAVFAALENAAVTV